MTILKECTAHECAVQDGISKMYFIIDHIYIYIYIYI